jgi:hypothetical protein
MFLPDRSNALDGCRNLKFIDTVRKNKNTEKNITIKIEIKVYALVKIVCISGFKVRVRNPSIVKIKTAILVIKKDINKKLLKINFKCL